MICIGETKMVLKAAFCVPNLSFVDTHMKVEIILIDISLST